MKEGTVGIEAPFRLNFTPYH